MAESLLPREIWLLIGRFLDDMRDYHAFALTCALFAALARAEIEQAKRRLAREGERTVDGPLKAFICSDFIVMGPCLARGAFHGRCFGIALGYVLVIEARDGLWQGEARCFEVYDRFPFSEFACPNGPSFGRTTEGPNGPFFGRTAEDPNGPPGYESRASQRQRIIEEKTRLYARFYFEDGKLDGKVFTYHDLPPRCYLPAVMSPLHSLDWRTEQAVDSQAYGSRERAYDSLERCVGFYEEGRAEGAALLEFANTAICDFRYKEWQGGLLHGEEWLFQVDWQGIALPVMVSLHEDNEALRITGPLIRESMCFQQGQWNGWRKHTLYGNSLLSLSYFEEGELVVSLRISSREN